MLLEAVRAFRLRLHGQVQTIEQGQALDLDQKNAEKLLSRAPGLVRVVEPCDVTIEPAENVRPVYWESDGKILGPAHVSHVAKVGDSEFWLCLEFQNSWRWVNSDLLRTQDAFDRQGGQRICHCCGGSEFWESIHGATVCQKCHPPAVPSVVKGEF